MSAKKSGTRVTIRDVALLADVSVSTVSFILKDIENNRFPESTRKRVLDAVKELQYQPAIYAQQMRGKRLQVIGLIIPDLTNHYFPEVTTGFTKQANNLGYNVILLNSDNSITREQIFAEELIAMRVSGVAICGVYTTDEREKELIRRLQNQGIPVIRFDRFEEDNISPYVGINNFEAGYMMTNKLLLMGHRKIVCLAPDEPVHIVAERQRGYRKAMQDWKQTVEFKTFRIGNSSDISSVIETLWSSSERPSAIFTPGGDMDAIKCIRTCDSLHISVPNELSIAGFDDIYVASVIHPGLTTIRQPKFKIGQTAMNLLYQLIKKEKGPCESVLLPFEYIQRGSTKTMN